MAKSPKSPKRPKDPARPTRAKAARPDKPATPDALADLLNPAINKGTAGMGSGTGLQPPPDNSFDRRADFSAAHKARKSAREGFGEAPQSDYTGAPVTGLDPANEAGRLDVADREDGRFSGLPHKHIEVRAEEIDRHPLPCSIVDAARDAAFDALRTKGLLGDPFGNGDRGETPGLG